MAASDMRRHLSPRALERAQWISDLSTALADAEKLLSLLKRDGSWPRETERLRVRVQTVRAELKRLNRVVPGEGRILGRDWPDAKAG
jgi:hypothetical protein